LRNATAAGCAAEGELLAHRQEVLDLLLFQDWDLHMHLVSPAGNPRSRSFAWALFAGKKSK
jgi:hypothetical protein